MDHDAAEGYELDLEPGAHRVTLYKAANPDPAANPGPTAARSVDAILITSGGTSSRRTDGLLDRVLAPQN